MSHVFTLNDLTAPVSQWVADRPSIAKFEAAAREVEVSYLFDLDKPYAQPQTSETVIEFPVVSITDEIEAVQFKLTFSDLILDHAEKGAA